MGKCARLLAGMVVFCACTGELARGASGQLGVNFTAITMNDTLALGAGNASPPDVMGAVGPNHVAELLNGAFAVYNKSNGTRVGSIIRSSTFWTNAGIPAATVSGGLDDSRMYYDSVSGRWFAMQVNTAASNNTVLVARSQTNDPSGAWNAVSFAGSTNGKFLDYATMGVTGDAVIIGGDMYSGATHTGESLFAIPKSALLAATPTTTGMTRFDDFFAINRPHVLQPANGTATGAATVLGVDQQDGRVYKFTVNNPGTPGGATVSARVSISSTGSTSPALAHQPDGTQTIDTIDNRITGAVQQVGDTLWMTHTFSSPTPGLRTYRIDNLTNAATITAGLGGTGLIDYFQPSIAVSSAGRMLIGHNRSWNSDPGGFGSQTYLGISAQYGLATPTTFTLQGMFATKNGEVSNYHLTGLAREPWGDSSATWVDPSDPYAFWTFQSYVAAKVGGQDRWATQISQVYVPEPSGLMLLSVAAMVALRRRRAG